MRTSRSASESRQRIPYCAAQLRGPGIRKPLTWGIESESLKQVIQAVITWIVLHNNALQFVGREDRFVAFKHSLGGRPQSLVEHKRSFARRRSGASANRQFRALTAA